MTARANAAIAYRSLALWFGVSGAYDAAGRLPFFDAEWVWHRVAYSFFPPAVDLVASYLLWRFADRLARATFPKESDATLVPNLDTERLLAVAFSILGAWCVVQAAPSLISGVVALQWYSPAPLSSGSESLSADPKAIAWLLNAKAWTVTAAIRLVIGLFLLAGPNRLARAVRRIRLELSDTLHDDASVPTDTNEPTGGP